MLTYERARKVAEETLGSRTAANSYTNGTHAVFYPAPTVVADTDNGSAGQEPSGMTH